MCAVFAEPNLVLSLALMFLCCVISGQFFMSELGVPLL